MWSTTQSAKTFVVVLVMHPFFQLGQMVWSDAELKIDILFGIFASFNSACHGEVVAALQ